MIGPTLGHYRVLDKLGAGGMNEVYRDEYYAALAVGSLLGDQVLLTLMKSALTNFITRRDNQPWFAEHLLAME